MENQNIQKGNLYLIIAIIVGVVAIGAVGFASWKYFGGGSEMEKEKSQPSYLLEQEKTVPQIEEQEEIISSKKTDEMADWKTYKNKEYGYEIKYPKNWNYGPNILKEKSNIVFCPPEFSDPNDLELKCKWISQDGHMPKSLAPIELFVDKLKDFSGKTTGKGFWKDSTGTYLYRLNLSNKSYQNVYSQMLSTFKFIKVDETADWKNYENEKYGFEVKYPKGWKLLKLLNQYSFNFGQEKNINKPGYDGEWFISVFNKSEKTAENIIKDMGDQFGKNRKEKRENITINNIPALKVLVTTSTISDWYYESIIIEQQEKIYWIHNGAVKNSLFNEFYNSFKFVKADEISDWKTYKNKEYGFEIKYPNQWIYREHSSAKWIDFAINYSKLPLPDTDQPSLICVKVIQESIKDSERTCCPKKMEKEEIVVNGINAMKITLLPIRGNDFLGESKIVSIEIPMIRTDEIIIFENIDDYQVNIFNQILSTFKFTD